MKRIYILTLIMAAAAGSAFADVKIKTKQTMSGQVSENTVYIKGKRQRTESFGGIVSLMMCDLGRDVQMNPAAKTYTISHYGSSGVQTANFSGTAAPATKGGTMFVTTTTRDTGERQEMFGYMARHIIQTIEMESSADACNPTKTKMEIDMWVIDAEFGISCAQDVQYRNFALGRNGGCTDKVVQKNNGTGKTGYPLLQKMTFYGDDGKPSHTMTSEVVELSKGTLNASLFEVPSDYREVNDASQLYAGVISGMPSADLTKQTKTSAPAMTVSDPPSDNSIGEKKPGTVRIGLVVKTGSVGENITSADLAAAVKHTFTGIFAGTKVEIVPLQAQLAAAVSGEAREKECDLVLTASASHKKGGGGFGFGKMLGSVVGQTGIGHTGSVVGNIAGQMATAAIVSAASMSGNLKAKDELAMDVSLVTLSDGRTALTRQFKAKASSDGQDIISAVIEQAANAILAVVSK
ncbi:MAG: DUF4412 domain-containing protein [Acidobacteria bacterium]|nr:DUF4412 domain-containing protein [Acidobacteriota bacterium]